MAFTRKRGRRLDSEEEDEEDTEGHEEEFWPNRRTRLKAVSSYVESDPEEPTAQSEEAARSEPDDEKASYAESGVNLHSFPVKLRIGVAAAKSLSEQSKAPGEDIEYKLSGEANLIRHCL